MATTITLTGRLADITSAPIDEVTRVQVKAPSYRPGPGVELTTTAPTTLDVGGDGAFTVNVVEGVGWLYIEGPGWSDTVRFVAAVGMTTMWEAVVNAMPIVVEAKRLLTHLGDTYEEYRGDLITLGNSYKTGLLVAYNTAVERLNAKGDAYVIDFAALKSEVESTADQLNEAYASSEAGQTLPPYLTQAALEDKYALRNDVFVNVKGFGAAWDGVTDDTDAINACAEFARDNGGTVYFPAGKGKIAGKIIIYGSLTCDGEVVMHGGDVASIEIQKSSPAVELQGLSGLTKGTVRISGLPDKAAGTLFLQNTNEAIINRYAGTGEQQAAYYKAEVSPVSLVGVLKYPLANTYVYEGAVTALFEHDEKPIDVSGLRVTIVGDARTTPTQSKVFVNRSNVTINDLEVYNLSSVEQGLPVVVRNSSNVEFNRPKISGFYHSAGGYGIMAVHTADVRVRDADISEVRHAISGQKNKALQITGGKYEGGIDDHWTYGMSVSGVTSIVRSEQPDISHIHTAGHGDVTVRDCTLIGGMSVMSIRSDTPELDGAVRLEGINWRTDVTDSTLYGIRYYSTNLPAYDYGRPYLWAPHLVSFKDWEIQVSPDKSVQLVQATGPRFAHHGWGDINVEDVRLLSGSGLTVYVSVDPDLRPADSRGPRIVCRNVEFVAGQQWPSVWVQNTSTTPANETQAAEVDISNCRNVAFTFAEHAVKRVNITNSSILKLHRNNSAPAIPQRLIFRNNIMTSVWMTGWWAGHFFNNIWQGDATSETRSMDGRAIAYMGNLHEVGATGFPSRPDGYRDTSVYQAEPIDPA